MYKLKDKIEDVEAKINQTQRVKEKLLNTARDFIEDNRPDNCPVCRSEINVDQLVKQLKHCIDDQDEGVISGYREERKNLKNDLQ